MIEEINEQFEGVNIRKGFILKIDKRYLYNKKENGCWYVLFEGNDVVIIFDVFEIQEYKNRYKEMLIILCEVLKQILIFF